ncbi:MAG: N-6 DNA methylase [Deltaproteobacteria bacterium]|nr:N-6 DNA methylase [Deltaproteobacteria bacterium]
MADVASSLIDFGADPTSLRLLDGDGPELLPYATLLTARRSGNTPLGVVEAVYEWQGTPLIFLVDSDSLEDDEQLHRVRRLLAMRGDAPYLGVVAPGHLSVYRIALDKKSLRQARVAWQLGDSARSVALARLGNIRPQSASRQRDWISGVVLNLLTGSTTEMIERYAVSDGDAVSLVGRALFTRFLADRNLLPDGFSSAASLFDTRELAEVTSNWLDETFNGDLLPLSENIFTTLPDGAYRALGDVLRRAPDSQLFLGWEQKWDNLDFAHIPVGVLSQAYELYLRNHAPRRQRREGGYYTPRLIADLMVRASFRALGREGVGKTAKILDPAAGGGIFLLTAFRELIAEHWRADKQRPDTNALRRILSNQIVGLDTNEAALRFAALGLYLASIELDPNPRPVDKLRFDNLRGTVLHRVTAEEESAGLGSLGPFVGAEHVGQYDLVIGNPPWASGTKLPDWDLVRQTVARIAADRKVTNASPPLPNEGLDLPFVWRAMEWAKPNGQIAFALHARLLFQQGDGMPEARQALFEALDVTSIINGVELRQTKVWPQVSAPFCILLAANRTPGTGGGFRFVTPRIEGSLNGAGSMRIDALNAEVVPSRQLIETPDILKILFRGTKADFAIVERIRASGFPTLGAFWRETIGVTEGGQLRGSGNGYQALRPSSRVRQGGDGRPGVDASYLWERPEITVASLASIFVDSEILNAFSLDRIHDPRSPDLFAGPLVVVHKSPPATTGRIGVAISEEGIVFNETFYGYSPCQHPDASMLVRYLALVLGSKLVTWLALVTSGEFGFEREVIEKATLDRIPLPNFHKLQPYQLVEIANLTDGLNSGAVSWHDVDEWVMRLYGLGPRDMQVIADTLEFNLPFATNQRNAQAVPSPDEKKRFCEILTRELTPWCERFGLTLTVRQIPSPEISPWQGIDVRTTFRGEGEAAKASDWEGLIRAADEAAASEVLVRDGTDGLLIGRLAQRRYWSETQARLLAQRIIWSHVDLLKGPATK